MNGRDLSARNRLYGVPTRLRRFRWEVVEDRSLLRWFPPRWFVDPYALVDLCTPWEQAWVRRHLARAYTGSGAIVELGPWLGDITLSILRGLDGNPSGSESIVDSYDIFTFEDIEARVGGHPLASRFRDGESFLPHYLERLGKDRARVNAHQGDVLESIWPPDRPIEFLFNDVAKTWVIWNHVKGQFYRALQADAVVVEQDWVHACTPWIHLWHHRYRSHFEPLGHVPFSGSMPFRVRATLPDSAFEPDAFSDYTADEIASAFDWATSLVTPKRQADVRGAHVHLYTLHGDLAQASRICVEELARSSERSELTDVALAELARRLREERPAETESIRPEAAPAGEDPGAEDGGHPLAVASGS